jgi:hypothetical protein
MDAGEDHSDGAQQREDDQGPRDPLDPGAPRTSRKRAAVPGGRLGTFHDHVVGRPGSKSADEALALVRTVLAEAAGFPPLNKGDDELTVLIRRAARSLDHVSGGKRVRGLYRPRVSVANAALSLGDGRPDTADGLSPNEDARAHHARMPYSEIPTWWFQRIQQTRGKGDTRSKRAYFEAIHILSYVMFMYSGADRFNGRILWVNSDSLCKLYCMTKGDYVKAVRHLTSEGYIHWIVIRGYVPWSPRAKGVYTFAVPRLAKVRASNYPRARRAETDQSDDPALAEE